MDPASCIISFGVLAYQIGATLQRLNALKSRFDSADLTISLLVGRLSVIRQSLIDIGHWSEDGSDGKPSQSSEFKDALNISLQGCHALLQCLDCRIDGIFRGSSTFGSWQRGKFVWKADILKEFEGRLDSEISALKLLLTSYQWFVYRTRVICEG